MDRIVLHGGIANCYKFLNPDDDLLDYVSENDGFAIALLERPEFLRADPLFLPGFFQDLGEYITTTDIRQVETILELDSYGI